MKIIVIATLDTKGEEADFIRDEILKKRSPTGFDRPRIDGAANDPRGCDPRRSRFSQRRIS